MHSDGSLARNPRWKQVLLKLAQDLKVSQLRKGYFVEDFILDFLFSIFKVLNLILQRTAFLCCFLQCVMNGSFDTLWKFQKGKLEGRESATQVWCLHPRHHANKVASTE